MSEFFEPENQVKSNRNSVRPHGNKTDSDSDSALSHLHVFHPHTAVVATNGLIIIVSAEGGAG
jgi:hypothetical protein